MLHTTFAKLHEAGACTERYPVLAKALGGITKYGRNTPIPLARILETNGLGDALWALQATTENSARFSRLLACDYAEHVLPNFEKVFPGDSRVRDCIAVARRYALGQATIAELRAAERAAKRAAERAAKRATGSVAERVTAWAAAWAAKWAAESAAESATAWAAAWAAEWAAESAAERVTENGWQQSRLLEMLEVE